MDRRVNRVLSFTVLVLALGVIVWGSTVMHEGTYEDVKVKWHSVTYHSLGYFQQDEVVRARVVVDEGSVKVLEGRVAHLQLLDDANKASMERGEGYVPLREVVIDTKETDVGELEYTAHTGGTYYIMYRNEDFWNLTLKVADGEALTAQLTIKVFAFVLLVVTLVVWSWFYGRLFDVSVRAMLGLVRRPRGPGSTAARERVAPSPEEGPPEGPELVE